MPAKTFISSALWTVLITMIVAMPVVCQSPSAQVDELGRWINGVSEPWWFPETMAKDAIAKAQEKWSVIAEEKQAGPAGTYFTGGDTHGSYLRWSKQNGFVLVNVDKCQAKVMSISYGTVVATPTSIQLLPERTESDVRHSHPQHSAERYVVVSWMGSQHLVQQDLMSDYMDYAAGLGKYNDASLLLIEWAPFYVRMEVEKSVSSPITDSNNSAKPQWIPPVVPPGYQRLIRTPVSATIVGVGKSYVRRDRENEWWDDLITPVKLKLSGGKPKLKMKLYVTDSAEVVRITGVAGRSATGVITRSTRKRPCVKIDQNDDCADPDNPPIKAGWKASTFRDQD